MEFYSVIKKNKMILSEGKWMDLENMLSKGARLKKAKVTFSPHMRKPD
jgi:hypothetical protein